MSSRCQGQLHQPGPFTGEHQICRSSPREPAGTSRRSAAPGSVPSPAPASSSRAPPAVTIRNAGFVLGACGLRR